MTQKKILKVADTKKKQIIELSKKIKKEVKYLPDMHSIARISNYINSLNALILELDLLKKVLI